MEDIMTKWLLLFFFLYITTAIAEDKPPVVQTSPNISLTPNQNTLTQINNLFANSNYKKFRNQPKEEPFKIPTKP